MRKTVILIVVIVILILVSLYIVRSRNEERKTTSSSRNFKGVQKDDQSGPTAKVNMILSGESKLLSYSIVLKGMTDDVESVHFTSHGKDIYQASGPRSLETEGSEVVVHGMWREKSRIPLTDAHIKDLVDGNIVATVRFKNQNTAPFRVEMKPKM